MFAFLGHMIPRSKCLYLDSVYEENIHSKIHKINTENGWNFSVPLLWFIRIANIWRSPRSLDSCYGSAMRGTTRPVLERSKGTSRAEQRMGGAGLGSHPTVTILDSSMRQRVLQRIFAYCLTTQSALQLPEQPGLAQVNLELKSPFFQGCKSHSKYRFFWPGMQSSGKFISKS